VRVCESLAVKAAPYDLTPAPPLDPFTGGDIFIGRLDIRVTFSRCYEDDSSRPRRKVAINPNWTVHIQGVMRGREEAGGTRLLTAPEIFDAAVANAREEVKRSLGPYAFSAVAGVLSEIQGGFMRVHRDGRVFLVLLCISSLALSQQGRRPPEEKTIRDADAVWSHAIETKDLEQALSFYSDDASVLPFNAPIATGRQQIRQVWSHLLSTPGFSLRFAPSTVEVARSGDLAYEVGTFELTMNDAQGKPVATPGKYVVVWKQADGKWKATADIFNTDVQSSEKQ
jgi:uncharacterized protein (TIGR02246 family)